MKERAKIRVEGVVQGVGFRPFVYRLAERHRLAGWVRNTSGSVEIEAEGDGEALAAFLVALRTEAPPRSRIETVEVDFTEVDFTEVDFTKASSLPGAECAGFVILESQSRPGARQLIPPDIATCEDCRREIFSSDDRRFSYPFTNCTNCGPRFTIIEDIPYDRPKTTMRTFTMCPQCQQEYDDPADRRFHAQPNACSVCGPALELLDDKGVPLGCKDPLQAASGLLREGKIIALKGLGGFHLVCGATDTAAIGRLRERKNRPSKPFAVMMTTTDEIEAHCTITLEERELLASPEAPIVLLRWDKSRSTVSSAVAPNLCCLGVFLPYTPLHHILLRAVDTPLVMTSGNMSGEPPAKGNDEALSRLGKIADFFLMHDRDINLRCDDSVCLVEEGATQVIRRARGYAPNPIALPFTAKRILACGADLKNTFCLTAGKHAFLSPHIGDMGDEETLDHFLTTIEHYKQIFRIEPEMLACDMHPDYFSSKYARQFASEHGLRCVAVQHHHAHIVSCAVENGIDGLVIGVAFDGTGYGTDGAVWGGEFLVADRRGFERVGRLEYIPLPGGEAAIRRPYRAALGYLYALLGEDVSLNGLPVEKTDPIELEVIAQQVRTGVNSPLTSSAGRLFDAVAALIGVRGEIDYEGQGAIELEMIAVAADTAAAVVYPFSIDEAAQPQAVRLSELFAAIIIDMRNEVPMAAISLRFHKTVAAMIAALCRLIADERGIEQVLLSGGVFQNRLLLQLAMTALKQEGLTVFTHQRVPCNDGGISLGQAAIADCG